MFGAFLRVFSFKKGLLSKARAKVEIHSESDSLPLKKNRKNFLSMGRRAVFSIFRSNDAKPRVLLLYTGFIFENSKSLAQKKHSTSKKSFSKESSRQKSARAPCVHFRKKTKTAAHALVSTFCCRPFFNFFLCLKSRRPSRPRPNF